MIQRLLALVAALCLAAAPALSRPINIPSDSPVAGIELPGGWTTTATKRGVEVKSPDEEVFFWVEVYQPAQYAAVVAEHERYFGKQGVAITGEGRTSSSKDGNVQIKATAFPATWKGDPTVLRYLSIDPGLPSKSQILLSYWASPKGDKTHEVAFQGVLQSLGPPR